jgi:mRNA interferase MazF
MIRRGDIVTVAAPGDFGKPRPAVVIQADELTQAGSTGTILALITSTLRDAPLIRLTIAADEISGLQKTSQIQTNRIVSVRTERIGQRIGQLTKEQVRDLDRLLSLAIGLA